MANTYTTNLALAKPVDGDLGWGDEFRANMELLDTEFGAGGHMHDGTPGEGPKLAQENTHQNPDTDSAPTALHHTLGTGANQVAAGNHTHTAAAVGAEPVGMVATHNTATTGVHGIADTSLLVSQGAAYVELAEGAAPATPAAGKVRIYAKADGSVYQKDDTGLETRQAGGFRSADVLAGWFNVADYGAVGDGVIDDTAGIQAAIDAAVAAGGGVVYFPAGVYMVGGALQEAKRSNAQLLLPRIDLTSEQITIVLRGELPPPQVPSLVTSAVTPDGGSMIQGTLNVGSGGALIGAWGPGGSYEDFSMVHVVIEDLTFRMPSNPVLTALNLYKVAAVELRNVMVHTGSYTIATSTQPTTASSYGILLPGNNNGAWTVAQNVNVIGYYYGYGFGEHTNADQIGAWACRYAGEVRAAHHASHIKRLLVVHCQNGLHFTGGAYSLEVEQYDVEHWNASPSRWYNPVYDIDDASDYAAGHITWHAVLSNSGRHNSFVVNGGSNLYTRRLSAAPRGGASTLAGLTDVDLAGLAVGDILQWNGTEFVPVDMPSGGGGTAQPFTVVFTNRGDVILKNDGTIATARSA